MNNGFPFCWTGSGNKMIPKKIRWQNGGETLRNRIDHVYIINITNKYFINHKVNGAKLYSISYDGQLCIQCYETVL